MVLSALSSVFSCTSTVDILRESLSRAVAEAIHVFDDRDDRGSDDDRAGGFGIGRHRSRSLRLMQDLKERLGEEKIQIRGAAQMALLGPEYDALFIADSAGLVSLAQWRLSIGNKRSAVCSLTGGQRISGLIYGYLSILAAVTPQDVLVTTCDAESKAILSGIDQARALFESSKTNISATPKRVNVVAIHPGLDVARFGLLDRNSCRKLLGLPTRGTLLLCSGKFADLEPLAHAFRVLLDEDPDLHLALSDLDFADSSQDNIAEFCQWLHLGNQTSIVPTLDSSLRTLLYSAADIVVSLVDSISSACDSSLLEVMASGIPIIASDWGGNRDIISHGQNGFLIPTLWNEAAASFASWFVGKNNDDFGVEDYLARRTVIDIGSLIRYLKILIANRDLRERFGSAGRKKALECFNWDVAIQRFRSLWEDQVNEGRAHRSEDTPSEPLSLNDMFRQYGSAALDFETEIVNSERGVLLAGAGEANFPLYAAGAVGEFQNEIQRILEYCTRPKTIRAIVDSGNEFSYEAAVWLLKKGICESR